MREGKLLINIKEYSHLIHWPYKLSGLCTCIIVISIDLVQLNISLKRPILAYGKYENVFHIEFFTAAG